MLEFAQRKDVGAVGALLYYSNDTIQHGGVILGIHESLSRGYEDTPEKQARFRKEIELFQGKWKDVLANGDPYYNPNLTLEKEDFSIRI